MVASLSTKLHLSGNSSKSRGLTEAGLHGKPTGFATPNVLVRLASQADKVLVYWSNRAYFQP